MTDFITIKVAGIDKLLAKLTQFPDRIRANLRQAGHEAGTEIVETPGLGKYPPPYHAAQPFKSEKQRRFFFWALGEGIIDVPYRRGQSPGSQRLGTQFYVQSEPGSQYVEVTIGNRAGYAPHVIGEDQSAYMAGGGWRKLREVAVEKTARIVEIFEAWVTKAIRDLGL